MASKTGEDDAENGNTGVSNMKRAIKSMKEETSNMYLRSCLLQVELLNIRKATVTAKRRKKQNRRNKSKRQEGELEED